MERGGLGTGRTPREDEDRHCGDVSMSQGTSEITSKLPGAKGDAGTEPSSPAC